mmetsp:Transcript_14411/g.40953  ORF Transcript_14411/g.40953 Transcript_14411/m.40953 type:complete len:252 (-) Transcript_14411:85-840(-)
MTELQATIVIYCKKCGMPPEYCEYGPDFEEYCDPWLKKNHPQLRSKLAALRRGDGDDDAEDAAAATKQPWTVEERLVAFYEKYQPDKLDNVPTILEKYAGKEEKLFVALVKKYGPEPEDPYEAESDDEEGVAEDMESLNVGDAKKRRGVKAKKGSVVETRVIIQKITRQKRKATTVVIGMETIPGIKLKDASKTFSKRFAGSSSVKDGPKGKEIIIQGDHMEDVAEMLVSKFKVPGSAVFLDIDGEFLSYA